VDGLKWSKTFETGIAEIDSEHRNLFALADSVGDALTRQDLRLADLKVGQFIAAAEAHFANEEAILAREAFPDLEAHKRYHVSLVDTARRLREVCSVEQSVNNADRCYHEVLAFLVDDVVRGDTQFTSFLHHRGHGGG
jgi:hemerythrin